METSQPIVGAETLSLKQVAEILGVARTTVEYRIHNGSIQPLAKLPGKTGAFIFDRDYIEELAAQKQPAALAGATGSQDKEI